MTHRQARDSSPALGAARIGYVELAVTVSGIPTTKVHERVSMQEVSLVLEHRSLIIPVGAAGSGKSTLLGQVAEALADPGFRFGNDDVRRLVCAGPFCAAATEQVAAAARAMVGARLAHDMPAALDCTNTGQRARAQAISLARSSDAKAIALLSQVPAAVVRARNAGRTPDLVVPINILESMLTAMESITPEQLLSEGFDEVHTFDERCERLIIHFV